MHANLRLIRCESYLWMPAKLLVASCRHLPSLKVERARLAHRWDYSVASLKQIALGHFGQVTTSSFLEDFRIIP